jgi:cysteinyl-tRNA synthetase
VALADEPFYQALCDDLNTPVAIAEVHALAKALHKAAAHEKPALKARMLAAGELLGILQQDPQQWLQSAKDADAISTQEIESLIAQRHQAKLDKNYDLADEIREGLVSRGVILEDSREGTRWKRA